MPALLPRFDAFAVAIPEIGRKLAHARVEEIGVLEHLVVEIILGGEAQRVGLDPHVDVLRDQNDVAPRMRAGELHHNGDDVVVGLAFDVVPDQGGAGVERLPGVHDRVEGLVFDVDQIRRVLGQVAVVGDDEGDRLARVADGFGGQAALGAAVGESRMRDQEGQVGLAEGEIGGRVNGDHAWNGSRGGGID